MARRAATMPHSHGKIGSCRIQSKRHGQRPCFLLWISGCRKSGLRHFFEVFIAPLRLRRGQGAMQGNPCYARLFADLTRMSPNPIKASGGQSRARPVAGEARRKPSEQGSARKAPRADAARPLRTALRPPNPQGFFDRLGSKAKGMAKGHAFCFGSETIYFSHAGKPAQSAGDTGSPPAASGGPYAGSGLARAEGLRNAVGWGLQQNHGILPAAGRRKGPWLAKWGRGMAKEICWIWETH